MDDDHEPAAWLPPEARVEPTPRWIRAELEGRTVGDSRRAQLHVAFGPPLLPDEPRPLLPGYFFPMDDVATDVLTEADEHDGRRWWHATVDDRTVEQAAWAYLDPTGPVARLDDHLTFRWEAVDAWYEEAEEVFVHARDPRKRVDVLASDRTVEVALDGTVVARSDHPMLLFETDLPTRYYFPPEDVDLDLLVASDTRTECPYKGSARYWSIPAVGDIGEDIAWSYPEPITEQLVLTDLVAFHDERADVTVDGHLQQRPRTPWS